MDLSRRDFLKGSSAVGAASLTGLLGDFLKSAPKMPTRPLGKMGWDVSIYAVGTAEMPAGERSVQALRELMDAGVNYIDTAPSYQSTRSETLVGQAVAGRRDQVWISTKTL